MPNRSIAFCARTDFKSRDGKPDVDRPAMLDHVHQRPRSSEINVRDAARLEYDQTRLFFVPINHLDHAALECWCVGEKQRRLKSNDGHALLIGTFFAASSRPPYGGAGKLLEFHRARSGRHEDAVDQG